MPATKTKARVKPVAKTARIAKVKSAKARVSQVKSAKAKPAKAAQPKPALTKPSKNGYDPLAPARVQDILNRLDQRYPNVTCALHHKSAWELLIATILSAQCTDVMVNKVTPILFQQYPTPQAMAAASPEELEPILRPTGFYRNKAKSVVGASKGIMENFGGQVPDEMDKTPHFARRGAEDRQRGAGDMVPEGRWRSGGYARSPHLPKAGTDKGGRSEEYRARPDEGDTRRQSGSTIPIRSSITGARCALPGGPSVPSARWRTCVMRQTRLGQRWRYISRRSRKAKLLIQRGDAARRKREQRTS